MDIGAYGNPKSDSFKGPATIAKIESFVIDHNGYAIFKIDTFTGLSHSEIKRERSTTRASRVERVMKMI